MEDSPPPRLRLGSPAGAAWWGDNDSPAPVLDLGPLSAPTAPTAPTATTAAAATGFAPADTDNPTQHLEFDDYPVDDSDEDSDWLRHCQEVDDPHNEAGPSTAVPPAQNKKPPTLYFWQKETYFPEGTGTEGILKRSSRLAACKFTCMNPLCPEKNCIGSAVRGDVQFADSDVGFLRSEFNKRLVSSSDGACTRTRLLFNDMRKAYSNPSGIKGLGVFDKPITCQLEDSRTVNLCIRSYSVVVAAVSYDLFVSVRADITQDRTVAPAITKVTTTQEAYAALQAWIRAEARFAEHDPVPGVQVGENTFGMKKETWSARWKQCCDSFAGPPSYSLPPGNRKLFILAWKNMPELHDRTDIKHDKCIKCKLIQVEKERLKRKRGRDYESDRDVLDEAEKQHEKYHKTERSQLDDACHYAVFYPEQFWTIAVDAATQSNFVLPKLTGRKPKSCDTKHLWGVKLFGAYGYGYGLRVHAVPDYVEKGAQLTITVIHELLMAMVRSGRPRPSCLHIQLDNTSGENKNSLVFVYACYLVESGFFKSVRLFFLPVGHTHIFIDHIFGTFTKKIRGKTIPDEDSLLRVLREACANKPTYMLRHIEVLHGVWSWKEWFKSVMGDTGKDMEKVFGGFFHGSWMVSGFRDFQITANHEGHAKIQWRTCSQTSDYHPANGEVTFFKECGLPTGIPSLGCPTEKWFAAEKKTAIATYVNAMSKQTADEREALIRQWHQRVNLVPTESYDSDKMPSCEELHLMAGAHANARPAPDTGPAQSAMGRSIPSKYRHLFDDVENPDFDAVHHQGRTKAAVRKELVAFLSSVRAPTPCAAPSDTNEDTTYVFPGDFLIVEVPREYEQKVGAVSIGRVSSIHGNEFRSPSTEFTIALYRHAPQDGVHGLFGTFTAAKNDTSVLVGSRKNKERVHILCRMKRSDVLVYNVVRTKSNHISLDSLKALAEKRPSMFAIPQRLPASHMPTRSATRGKTRAPHRRPAAAADSSDEEEGAQSANDGERDDEEGEEEEEEDDGEESDMFSALEEAEDQDEGEGVDHDADDEGANDGDAADANEGCEGDAMDHAEADKGRQGLIWELQKCDESCDLMCGKCDWEACEILKDHTTCCDVKLCESGEVFHRMLNRYLRDPKRRRPGRRGV